MAEGNPNLQVQRGALVAGMRGKRVRSRMASWSVQVLPTEPALTGPPRD